MIAEQKSQVSKIVENNTSQIQEKEKLEPYIVLGSLEGIKKV